MYSKAGRFVPLYFCVIFCGLLLSGCVSGVLKPEERAEIPVPLEVTLQATEGVNPTARGRASPIVVRMFELENDAKFMAADYFELMGQDGASSRVDVIASADFILLPGEVRAVQKRAALNSRFLGIVAGYRDLTGSVWRAITPLPAPHLAGRVWTSSIPVKRLWVRLSERGATISEEAPNQ